MQNSMGTKGNVTGSLLNGHPNVRLEPLPVLINDGYECDRRLADFRGELGKTIKSHLRRGIENIILPQNGEPFIFVWG